MSDSEDRADARQDEDGDDLFGDEDDGRENASDRPQILSDAELASEDGEDGEEQARYRDEDGSHYKQVKDKVIMAVQIYRHRIPKPQDKTLRSIRVPEFLKFIPEPYDPANFEPSQFDLDNARDTKSRQAVRFMRDPETGELRSNSAIYRWSDGSVTLSVGSEHYEIQRKSLAPAPDKPYQEVQDGHYYVAAAELRSNLLMVVGHVSEQFTVRPSKSIGDDALSRLAERMAAAMQAREADVAIKITGDPELQRKKAELAEKEQMKAQRRRENAQARMEFGVGRYSRSGGLSVGDLEGSRRSGAPTSRKRGAAGSTPRKKQRHDYDSDDDLPTGVRRQDEYDLEDGFIAPSDEEGSQEGGGDDDDEEDEDLLDVGEESGQAGRRAKRQKTAEADEEVDAEGEADDEEPVLGSQDLATRGRRRTVIDDDDD